MMRPETKHAVPPAGDICRLSAIEIAGAIKSVPDQNSAEL